MRIPRQAVPPSTLTRTTFRATRTAPLRLLSVGLLVAIAVGAGNSTSAAATWPDAGPFPPVLAGVLLGIVGVVALARRCTPCLSRPRRRPRTSEMPIELYLAEHRERRRIARELDDRVSQVLLLAKLKIDLVSARASGAPIQGAVGEVAALIEQAVEGACSVTGRLIPALVDAIGLGPALAALAHRTKREDGLEVELSADGLEEPLPDELRWMVYESVRELLANATRHATTDRAQARLWRRGNVLYVAVEDRGAGFSPPDNILDAPAGGRAGLFTLAQRVRHLGGEMILDSTPGKGTRVTLRLPPDL